MNTTDGDELDDMPGPAVAVPEHPPTDEERSHQVNIAGPQYRRLVAAAQRQGRRVPAQLIWIIDSLTDAQLDAVGVPPLLHARVDIPGRPAPPGPE